MTIARADPCLLVLLEIEDQQAAAGPEDTDRFADRALRIAGVMERLREQGDVDRCIPQRQPRQVALLPFDVAYVPPRGKRFRALQHIVGPVDPGHRSGPSRRLEREIPFAAPDVGDVEGRQQVAEGAGPRRPAPAGHELARIALRVEALLAVTQDLLQARVVFADGAYVARRRKLKVEQFPQRRAAVAGRILGEAVVDEARFALLDDQRRFLQEPEMAGYARLRQPEDRGELADVEAILAQHAQQPETHWIGEQLEDGGDVGHMLSIHPQRWISICDFSNSTKFVWLRNRIAPHGNAPDPHPDRARTCIVSFKSCTPCTI